MLGTATKLKTARTINGTSFDGSGNITTSKWGTTRTLTLSGAVSGSTSMDGSENATINTTLNNFKVLEGTISVGTSESSKVVEINYPDGYTKDNCVVLSFGTKVGTTDPYYELQSDVTFKRAIYLANKINIQLKNMTGFNVKYKIVLMKVS